MTTINGNQNFKQVEGDTWLSTYLPAICAGTIMAVVLFLAVSCSKKADKPISQVPTPAAPAMTNPAPVTAAAVPAPPKKVRKHRPANATYVNGNYGVSFSYPHKYSLQAGDDKQAIPLQTGFVKPGAQEIAAVDMPGDSYPETDFSAALLNVSVNPGMTSEECAQFVTAPKDAGDVKPATVKLGANEYSEFEQINGEGDKKSDLKFFHLFKNGSCFEFALDVETSRADDDLAQVDRGKVFEKLEKIVTSARIKDVEMPGTEDAEKTSATGTSSADAKSADTKTAETKAADVKTDNTQKAQVVTPEQK